MKPLRWLTPTIEKRLLISSSTEGYGGVQREQREWKDVVGRVTERYRVLQRGAEKCGGVWRGAELYGEVCSVGVQRGVQGRVQKGMEGHRGMWRGAEGCKGQGVDGRDVDGCGGVQMLGVQRCVEECRWVQRVGCR